MDQWDMYDVEFDIAQNNGRNISALPDVEFGRLSEFVLISCELAFAFCKIANAPVDFLIPISKFFLAEEERRSNPERREFFASLN